MSWWINDKLGHSEKGMRWRTTTELQLNKVVLAHYIAASDVGPDKQTNQPNPIWFDNEGELSPQPAGSWPPALAPPAGANGPPKGVVGRPSRASSCPWIVGSETKH